MECKDTTTGVEGQRIDNNDIEVQEQYKLGGTKFLPTGHMLDVQHIVIV